MSFRDRKKIKIRGNSITWFHEGIDEDGTIYGLDEAKEKAIAAGWYNLKVKKDWDDEGYRLIGDWDETTAHHKKRIKHLDKMDEKLVEKGKDMWQKSLRSDAARLRKHGFSVKKVKECKCKRCKT